MKRFVQWAVTAIAVMTIAPSAFGQFLMLLTPSSLDFRSVRVGATSTQEALLVYQGTTQAYLHYHWSANTIQQDADQYTVTVSAADSTELSAGDTVRITVAYHPMQSGTHKAQYGFYMLGIAQMLTLNGTTVSIPDLEIKQSACNNVEVGQVGSCSMTFTNNSALDMRITLEGVDAPFMFTQDGGITVIDFFLLAIGESKSVPFSFTPTTVGYAQDAFVVINGNDTTYTQLEGNGVNTGIPIRLSVSPDLVELWAADSLATATQIITLTNNSQLPFDVSRIEILGPDSTAFSVAVSLPLQIPGSGSSTIEVTYTPNGNSAEVHALMNFTGGVGSFVGAVGYAGLIGRVGTPRPDTLRVGMSNSGGAVGETARIVFTNHSNIPSNIFYGQVTLRYNASVLVPQDAMVNDVIEDGMRTSTFRIDPASRLLGTILDVVKFTITLGDASQTNVDLVRMEWFDEQDSRLNTQTIANGAVVTVEDAEGRTVNASGEVMTLAVSPMPVADNAIITYSRMPGNARLTVYGTTGILVQDLSASLQGAPEQGSLQIDLSALPVGTYYMRLSVGTSTVVRRLIVN